MMEAILQDLRYELRTLIKSPRFTLIALITLVLGIAANVAIFTFVDAALIRPLPYRDSSRLMQVYDTRQAEVFTQFEASYPNFLDWRAQQQVFEGLAAYGRNQVLLRGERSPELLPSAAVTDNFFETLGVRPISGRDFRSGEDLATAPRTIMLSYGWWQQRFGGKDVIGQVLNIDDQPNTIVGVLPANFHFAPVGDPDVWVTLHATGQLLERRNLHWLEVVGRLKTGISRESAAAAMNVIAERLEKQYPQSNDKLRSVVVPLNEVIVGKIKPILVMLFGAVALLLLIACANVANLLLVRAMARRGEMAIRTALGASRARLVRLLLSEGLIISLTGATLGLLLAHWMVKGFVSMIPARQLDAMPYLKHMSIDVSVLLFAFLLAVITGVMFALAPAFQAAGANLQAGLKEGSRSSHSGSWRRFASALVIGEVAVAMVLLAGSGLLVKSLFQLLNVNPGFDQHNLLGMGVGMSQSRFPQDAQQFQAYRDLVDRIHALPGVKSVGSSSVLPVSGGGNTSNLRVVGLPSETPQGREANSRTVSRTYFQTLGVELLQGSWFTEADNATGPQRVIINKTLADRFMPGLDPLKQQIWFTYSTQEKPRQVIGVIRDIKEGPLDVPARPAIYTPQEAQPRLFFNLIVRTETHPDALVAQVQNAIRQVDPDAVVFEVQTMEDRIRRSPAAFLHRYPAVLAGTFAFLALLLGTVGLYGLVAYSVSQRTQEIGIRMALGAQRKNVLQMVLAQGVRLIVPGLLIGIAAALLVANLMRSLLFGVASWDPTIFAAITVLLAIVALAASYVPARAATKVDPMVALRYE
ncbi:MAG TPA: ABC transporter permease [Candidatus Angelobacter sp.]|jgi:predicted permease|nr:ABC transporter permease [Candidatus Angelobacter sp.]